MFSLVVMNEGNTFSHRHQLWFGLPFGCQILGNKSPIFFSLNIFSCFFYGVFLRSFPFSECIWLDFLEGREGVVREDGYE